MSRYLKIEWRNTTDLGSVYYGSGLTGRMLLDVEVERPEYPVEIESDLNGDNQEIAKFKKWAKEYKFEVWGTEDLVDAFTFMQIHDTINITLQTGQQISVDKMTVEYDWETVGCLAKITVSFTENYVVSTPCDNNLDDSCECDNYGSFIKMLTAASVEYTDPDANGVIVGDRFLFYDVMAGGGYLVNGKMIEYAGGGTWNEDAQSLYQCEYNETTFDYWVEIQYQTTPFSFWVVNPGSITEISQPGPAQIHIHGQAIPGFVDVYVDGPGGGGYVLIGTYTPAELLLGITLDVTEGVGTYNVKFTVRTHGCTHGDSNIAQIILT